MASASMSGYPVSFDVEYPEAPNRWLILVRWLLAVPHLIVLYFLGIIISVIWVVSFFTILIGRTYPESLYKFAVGTLRWNQNVMAYVLVRDAYPPFSMNEDAYEGVTFTVARPAEFNRWLVLVKWLLVIPHVIILALLQIVALFAFLWLFFGVLVTGQYPRPAFDFLLGVGRWSARVNAYFMFLVDEYPPFALK